MARATQAALAVQVVVFGFDPDPTVAPARALQVLLADGRLPGDEVERDERFAAAALRCIEGIGSPEPQAAGRTRGRATRPALHLVGLEDSPSRTRTVTAWYYAITPYVPMLSASWAPALGRPRLDAGSTSALKAAVEQLRLDSRAVAGAAALVGEVFTGDDLLRVHTALHGGPRGSERTFRRRVQELRDAGVLRPVRDGEVAAMRLRHPRFRSPAGTGGRPPELLRYAGAGGEEEQLVTLRARRSA